MKRLEHITAEHGLEMLTDHERYSLLDLGIRANELARQLHPEMVRTYIIERNINYTNVCRTRCSFCAFSVPPGDERGYILDLEQFVAKIEPLIELGGTQILLQGGMNPELPLVWYEQMLRDIRSHFPGLHIHAFSPPEIVFMSRHFEISMTEVLRRLREAGLDTIPGGGAEILAERVRKLIAPAKCSADEWLDVMRQAHRLGMHTTATMMFGHAETPAERIEHLDRLRALQDESLAAKESDPGRGCFTAFTCWPFQPGNTRLKRSLERQAEATSDKKMFFPMGAAEQLRMTALARLYLDNIPNIQASWVTQGAKIGQLSLFFGCNDLGSLMMEENVVSAAGTTYAMQLEQLRELIRGAGFEPMQRDYFYREVRFRT